MTDPYIGQMLENRYEILECIGIGGMSNVYKARCHRLNRMVAVKILRSDLAQDADFRRRFNAESQAVAQLSSPNIVQVYDVSKGGDLEYIVMELIDGITLKQYMERRGRLNWRESLHFITQIMRGLAHAHSKGIIHRDIKPQNIMILRDGSVKVADFGIACLENAAQTLTQQALGSVHYISPEQARGDHIDARSDIYSAGIVLYEMLTGRLPFEGESAVSVAIQHLSAVPPTPRSIDPDIPDQLELICMKAMVQDVNLRYPSAEAMIQDLDAFRKDPEVSLDFQMSDIRPPVTDEPTQPLRDSQTLRVDETQRRRQFMSHDDEENSRDVTQMILWGVAGFLGILLAVVLIRGILNSFVRNDPEEQHMVRSVIGYTVAQARELEGVNGVFEIVEAGSKFSDDYAPGIIMEQDPAENSYRKGNNLIIRVWVSSGEETAKMPDVVNQSVSQAEKVTLADLIRRYSLTVEANQDDGEYHDKIPAGNIVASEPEEGRILHRGDTIRLIVSKGPKPPATWPLTYFEGMKLELVLGQLKNLGLTRGSVDYEYSDEPEGTIIKQTPAAQTQVTDGTKVSFVVSKGPEPTSNEPEPAPTPEPEPEPEITTPTEKSIELVIPLPSEGETGYMELYQDGKRIESGTVNFNTGTYSMELTATGQTVVTVYMDQERLYNETIDMEKAGDRYILSKNDTASTDTTDNSSKQDSGAQTGPRIGEDGTVYPLDPEDEPGYQDPHEAAANSAIEALIEAIFGAGTGNG